MHVKHMTRDKTAYAYQAVGSGSPPFVFVHGWACDHSFLSPQIDHFSRNHRVIAADLCGHGASDAPLQNTRWSNSPMTSHGSAKSFKSSTAVLVGHSMGGVVALELAENTRNLPLQFA